MLKCPLCQKDKTEYEMRPLINVDELKVGNNLSDQKSEREVGGAKLQMVCRGCWAHILENKTLPEVIEILETMCGLLLELDRRRAESLVMTTQLRTPFTTEDIEKMIPKINRFGKAPAILPGPPVEITPMVPGGYPGWGDNTSDPNSTPSSPFWQIGTQGARINMTKLHLLGDEWDSASGLVFKP